MNDKQKKGSVVYGYGKGYALTWIIIPLIDCTTEKKLLYI